MMKYYPVFLDIKDKTCLVVGGGGVGARKAKTLANCGARVVVVSLAFSSGVDGLDHPLIECQKKAYEPKDLSGVCLVFAATNDPQLNRRIKADAKAQKVLCNVADGAGHSDFILPSVMHKGDLILAVSTSGTSPALARKIRQDLEAQLGPGVEKMLELMGNIRKKLLAQGHAPEDHKTIFYALIEAGLLEMIQSEDKARINAVLADVVGEDYRYQELISQRSHE